MAYEMPLLGGASTASVQPVEKLAAICNNRNETATVAAQGESSISYGEAGER